MSESKSPKPESLEAKFRLMTLAPFDKRMKRKHLAVYGFIIDWYHTKYGNALASVRHVTTTMKERDPSGEGFYLGDVHGALTDLVAWGYLTQEKGSGRRASRYIPVWSKSDSVRKSPNTTEDDPSVRETPNTSVRETPNTTADSVRDSTNEDPPTGPGHKTRGHVVGDKFEVAPVAPLTAALEGAVAGPASGDGFDEFWQAWPRKHGIKKARAEWKKIIFDVDIVIEMAGEWAAHYAKHGTDKKWIPGPANWLAGERWLEDLPLIHGDAKGAAIAKAKANAPVAKERAEQKQAPKPANDDHLIGNGPMICDVGPFSPFGEFKGKIIDTSVRYVGAGTEEVVVYLSADNPGSNYPIEMEHTFYAQHPDTAKQQRGQEFLKMLAVCAGVRKIDDTDILHGLRVDFTVNNRLAIQYAAAA